MNKRNVLIVTISVMLFSASFLVASEKLDGIATPTNAVQTFEEKRCVRCHLIDVSWEAYGPDLARASLSGNFSDIVGHMWNKAPVMLGKMNELDIDYPALNSAELIRVASFVGVYQDMLSAYTTDADVERGATLFHRNKCSNCHSSKRMLGKFQTPLMALEALWKHGASVRRQGGQTSVTWNQLSSSDVKDLIGFLTAAGHPENTHSPTRFQAPGNPRRGRKAFTELRCGVCHTNDGNLKRGSGKKTSGNHQNARLELDKIVATLWNHSPRVWKVANQADDKSPLSAQSVADLIAYWYSVRFDRCSDNAKLGEKLFESKSCASCHEVGADDFPNAGTKDELLAQMWSSVPDMVEACKDQDIGWPKFESGELAAIAEFLTRARLAERR